ncbi:hypothetical protein [Streptomyces canus]|uniref:hypothetical protein n=1 Tax=Streptomyces canus TaxID=58343 RepID=UPI00371230B6
MSTPRQAASLFQAFQLVVGAVDQRDPAASVRRVALLGLVEQHGAHGGGGVLREASIRRPAARGLLLAPSVKVPLFESFTAAAAGALVPPAFHTSPSP